MFGVYVTIYYFVCFVCLFCLVFICVYIIYILLRFSGCCFFLLMFSEIEPLKSGLRSGRVSVLGRYLEANSGCHIGFKQGGLHRV